MAGRNKEPLLGWHPPAGLSAWVRAEAEHRGVNLSVILNEAVRVYREMSLMGDLYITNPDGECPVHGTTGGCPCTDPGL